ncbi:hypothetical protein FHP88_15565 [Sedimenticola selenatireducens]|uniref:Uncharacterized protein n=1 Tax=Sedimenticola selenatireducens TaxID=191960 RepID=A0A557S0C1_9GAMM|nr:hypothetical protein [Sedimenticola selenatireducens]TVO70871.1 hypothetical protein FHP88_15565 [Sedimenticola selenatireducens]
MSKYQAMCPVCGAFGAPEIFLAEAIKREAIAKALRMPHPLAMQVQVYIGLFRPPKRGHSMDRVERILEELLEPIEAGKLRRNGRDWPAPVEIWKYALDQVISRRNKLTLPLKDHGYLFEVVAGESDRAEANAEKKLEEQRKHHVRSGPKESSVPLGYNPVEAWKRDMERLGRTDLVEKVEGAKSEE